MFCNICNIHTHNVTKEAFYVYIYILRIDYVIQMPPLHGWNTADAALNFIQSMSFNLSKIHLIIDIFGQFEAPSRGAVKETKIGLILKPVSNFKCLQ